MVDRRKRGASSGSVPSSRPRQRSRPSFDREGMLQRMEAAAVIVLVLSTVVTSVVVNCLLPKPRQIIHEPRRLDWEEQTADINRRGLYRRMYRLDEHTFNKLAEMLRTILERNEYYASEKREKYGEGERENRGVTEYFVFIFVNPTLLGFPIVSCGTAVQLERHNIAPAREPYPALFVHSCLVFPSFPVVQQYNWSTLEINVTLHQQESRTQSCLCMLGFPIVSCGTAVQLEYSEKKRNIAPVREPYWIDGPNKKSVTEKRGLLGNVGEGHDQRGGVLQRQVKMCLGHGPAPGNSI